MMKRFFVRRRSLLLLSAVALFLLFLIFSEDEEDPDDLDFAPLPTNTYAHADLQSARQYLTKYSWPTFQGYNNKYANEHDNPADEGLMERIQWSQDNLRSHTFMLKRRLRHKWKFEKIIHLTWKGESIPDETTQFVVKWHELNPEWTIMFWTDESQYDFIKIHYPKLLEAYSSWTESIQRADMFRLVALYAFGGVYADLDIVNLRPLDEVREWGSCILAREPDPQVFIMYPPLASWATNDTVVSNAFMACHSHHPFLHYAIARLVLNSPAIRGSACPKEKTILCTGPWMLSFAYTYYRRSIPQAKRSALPQWDVTSPHYKYFLPTYDPSRISKLKLHCSFRIIIGSSQQRQICWELIKTWFRNVPEPYSYTNHKWLSSYHKTFLKYVDVNSMVRTVMWTKEKDKDFRLCSNSDCRNARTFGVDMV